MGLQITGDEHGPYPRASRLILTCDAIGCSNGAVFADGQGFIAQRRAAVTAGWLERRGEAERQFLCPAYSGKRSQQDQIGQPETRWKFSPRPAHA
jgi:hypothetical protein